MVFKKLTEKEKDAVLDEIGYTRRQLDSDLEHIKEWLKLQQHLPPSRLKESDSFLTMFLTGCKGSLEKTKRKLDAYYTFRSHSELFDSRDPLDPGYVKMREMIYFNQLTEMSKIGTLLFCSKLSEEDQEEFDFLNFCRMLVSVLELWLREVGYNARIYMLSDYKGVTVNQHLMKVKPLLLKDLIYYILEVLPIRFVKLSFFHVQPFMASFINSAVLPFVSKKVKERLYITINGPEDIVQDLDKTTLPSDFGGDFLTMSQLNEIWRGEEIKRRDWYLNEMSERCDESKRIVVEDPTNSYFGVPGSLKKLVVD